MDYKIMEPPACPHCGAKMHKWRVPPDSTWQEDFHWVCFNDDCPYYVKGWQWMQEKYQHRSSYRCRINPRDGRDSPLPVWSEDALKGDIIPEGEDEKS